MEALEKFASNIADFWIGMLSFAKIQLSNITVTDVVDIVIMAVLLLFVYGFIRGRRAGKLVLGIVVWMAIFALGKALNLYTISFLFGYIFQAGIIALVVIFQPELRTALERVGGEPLRSLKGLSDNGRTDAHLWIRDVCEASSEMSRSKTGALMVFERSAVLTETAQSGIELDAKISSHLIRNVFFNKSPLHDGAILIRDGRLHAASCLLPLTRRSDIDQALGTRHRAAIGISEISDVFVVVVSEETGKISVVENGVITRDITAQALKVMLTERFVSQKDLREEIVAEVASESAAPTSAVTDIQTAPEEELTESQLSVAEETQDETTKGE